MPTFTTIALQNLLQHRNSGDISNSSTLNNTQSSTNYLPNHEEQHDESNVEKQKARKRLNHIYISPALYTTPEPTPILDYASSGSVSPSPYVFNRKGRGGGKLANRRIDGFEVEGNGEDELVKSSLFVGGCETENCLVVEGDNDDDDFVDPRCDSFSVGSSSELNDSGRLGFENMSMVSNQIGEFYDATEDFSSDGFTSSVASCSRVIESELHTTRLNLLNEIEKRKTAEYDLASICTHFQKVNTILLSGQPFLAPSNDNTTIRFDINTINQLSEEIIVVRFVAEAMGKAEARAEAELAADVIIGSKDKEISRLKDRMQYYESMIHEMSQKNLESMEVGRRERERKMREKKWLWSCIGMSIVIGASVIAYVYAPPQGTQGVADTQSN